MLPAQAGVLAGVAIAAAGVAACSAAAGGSPGQAGAVSAASPSASAGPGYGSALWFLGNPTAAGMHAGTLTFTAATLGTYRYLCPVPGHAQKGMAGSFTIR